LAQLKKIILAEFAFSQNGLLVIDGHEYNKTDVLKELENPNLHSNLSCHATIWEEKGLLDFLEQDILDMDIANSSWRKLSWDKDFVQFVSPYFAEPFNAVMNHVLKEPNFSAATELNSLNGFLQDADLETAYRSVRIFLEDSAHTFRNLNEKTFSKEPKVVVWTKQQFAPFLNSLPFSLLNQINKLAVSLINFLVTIQAKNKKYCYLISCDLIELENIDPQNKAIIDKNHLAFKQNHNRVYASAKSDFPIWRVIFWGLLIIRIIYALAHM
jgi:hypothetical protein